MKFDCYILQDCQYGYMYPCQYWAHGDAIVGLVVGLPAACGLSSMLYVVYILELFRFRVEQGKILMELALP